MAIFRVEKTRDFTVMSNHHLKNKTLSLKAKGLQSLMLWGSNGHMPSDRCAPVLPGVFRQSMPAMPKRIHQTEKPLGVMREIVKIVEPGGVILDLFAGAGTTILAAKLEGYKTIWAKWREIYVCIITNGKVQIQGAFP